MDAKDNANLGVVFKYFVFSSLPGEMIQFDLYFSDGLKPPASNELISCVVSNGSLKLYNPMVK